MFLKEMSSRARIVSVAGLLGVALLLGWALKQLTAQAGGVGCKGAAALAEGNQEACAKSFKAKRFTPSINSLPEPQGGALRNRRECSGGLKNEKEMKQICYLGASRKKAKQNIALIGDSHAAQWRPAMRIIAEEEDFRIGSVTASACNYRLPKNAAIDKSDCGEWRRQVPKWLEAHPEIDTVIFSQVASGGSRAEQEVLRGWEKLPESVKRIIVLRDSPRHHENKNECVKQAVKKGRAPGPACATKRQKALPEDPAVNQAKLMGKAVIDMSDSFCDQKRCYPVIGGVLVYADGNHQTAQFNRTTAPPLKEKLLKALGR